MILEILVLCSWNASIFSHWESYLESQGTAYGSCVPEAAKVVLPVGSRTWWCKSLPGGTGFEGIKGSWEAAEAWHCVAGLESLKRAQERLLEKVHYICSGRRQYFGYASVIGTTTKDSNR